MSGPRGVGRAYNIVHEPGPILTLQQVKFSTDIAILLIIVAACGCVFAWVAVRRWRRRAHIHAQLRSAEKLQEGRGGVPPFRIEIEPARDSSWIWPGVIESVAADLHGEGFADVGVFDLKPAAIRTLALLDAKRSIWGLVCEQPKIGLWLQLVTEFEDGTSITYSTDARATILDPAPQQILKSLPEMNAKELIAAFVAERPEGAMKPVIAEKFPTVFESSWARCMDWRISRGGVTADEIRRMVAHYGGEATPEMIESIQRKWRSAIDQFRQE